ncbi:MAG TPA: CDP-alcohol phosphatidyltransferase family protein, partial [Dehalococcoidia bacterium]|nr:CDP-alcohol phosphatidyltransferase family protein [Dehalococcoidia bacterium]
FGFLIAIGAGVLVGIGYPFVAGFVVLVGGFFDIVDGALARSTDRTTRFGAILDSTLDRSGEAVVFIGLLVLYTHEQSTAGVVVVGVVWLMSLLVSYIRARAEGIGLECEVGIFTRAERVVLLVLGLLLSQFGDALLIILAIIAALSFLTVIHRLRHVWRQTKTG